MSAIKAIPLHLSANDENAAINHRFCPSGKQSWCQYQAAISCKRPIPIHPNYLSQEAVDIINSTFDYFKYNKIEFINEISDRRPSNNNESIDNILFQMVKKTEAVGFDVMKLGAALAVIRFNDGFEGIKQLFVSLGIDIGIYLQKTRIISSAQELFQRKEEIFEEIIAWSKY